LIDKDLAVVRSVCFAKENPVDEGKNKPVYIYWSDSLFSSERLAAVLKQGRIEVKDQEALDLFIKRYEKDRTLLAASGKALLSWNDLLKLFAEK